MTHGLAIDSAQGPEFRDINGTITRLALVHVGVRPAKLKRDLPLSKAALDPCFYKSLQDGPIECPHLMGTPIPGTPGLGFGYCRHTVKCGESLTNPLIGDTVERAVIGGLDEG